MLKSNGALEWWVAVVHKFSHEIITSSGFLTTTMFLLALNGGANGIHHGLCVFIIHTVSSTISSPFIPDICNVTLVWSVLSAPVCTPVSNSKYFLRNVLPLRGKEEKATLFVVLEELSKNFASPSNIHWDSVHWFRSFDLNRSTSYLKFRTGVRGPALILIWLSSM